MTEPEQLAPRRTALVTGADKGLGKQRQPGGFSLIAVDATVPDRSVALIG
ncbi:hypothetical protein ACH4UM_08225 [Streptomyces sp. NPDC020801]